MAPRFPIDRLFLPKVGAIDELMWLVSLLELSLVEVALVEVVLLRFMVCPLFRGRLGADLLMGFTLTI
jgi:hypothetical protein